jgi:hypothetical protein
MRNLQRERIVKPGGFRIITDRHGQRRGSRPRWDSVGFG